MISFGLTDDQEMVQSMVRKLAADEIRPRLRAMEKARSVPDDLRRRFGELGVTLASVPERFGGMGLGLLTEALVHEELAYGDPGAAVALWTPHTFAHAVLELGSEAQKKRLLAPFVDDPARRGAVAYAEAGGDRPEEGFVAQAVSDGDGWRVTAEKRYVVGGGAADAYVVFAQVEPGAGWAGAGAFVVDGADVRVARPIEWVGLETVRAADVTMENARAERLEGEDWVAATQRYFARTAIVSAARQTGLARASFDLALEYTQDRKAFGKPVAHFQAISFTLAEMAMDVDAARWMTWKAAAELDAGAPGAVASAAKASLAANDAAWRVADHGVQLLGGAGFVQDFPAEKWMRDTKVLATMGPTDDLSRALVGAAAAGQPGALGTLPSAWIQPIVT